MNVPILIGVVSNPPKISSVFDRSSLSTNRRKRQLPQSTATKAATAQTLQNAAKRPLFYRKRQRLNEVASPQGARRVG